ncbi:alpha/beta hydrolase [Solihabitans fulvus]|uniref:Alpha/beta hydrolase n=1 Tax=Solihabitans fulvus TaxID=1892852 RepID=A0A5B2WLV5_9PSEU|nr:alpha/beta fold hydrolase [Solihabitans fulvus]KAA2252983.1 alpha/beta hydrolase [Solihabitans fulvus]
MTRQPRLDALAPATPSEVRAVVLVLHGGRQHDHGRVHRLRLAYLRMVPLARALRRAGRRHGLAVWLLRYRYRGWNAPSLDPVADARWALARARAVYPGRPVVLVGHSMGGRTALRVADDPAVVAVCALAPWTEADEPVAQLAGRGVLIAHGDRERWTDPALSHRFAARAKEVTARVCRFAVLGDGHAMLRRAADWTRLVTEFVLGELGLEPESPAIADAMSQPETGGLDVPLGGRPSRG